MRVKNNAQNKLHVRKGDRVKVIAGKDKGVVGEVIAVHPERDKVTVAGVNIVKRHLKDTAAQPQARQTTKGGIVSSEAPIHASNVQLVVKNRTGDEVVTRVGYDRAVVTNVMSMPRTRSILSWSISWNMTCSLRPNV